MNDSIGRCGAGGGTAHLTSLKRVRDWCDQHGVLFKVIVIVIFMVIVIVLVIIMVMVILKVIALWSWFGTGVTDIGSSS